MGPSVLHKAGWFWNRLRCMSPLEVLHRAGQVGLTRLVRHGMLPQAAPPAQLASCPPPPPFELDGLAARPYLDEADAILAGTVPLFATGSFAVGAQPEWNRDPLTGIRGPAGFGPAIGVTDRARVGDIKHVWELNRHLHLVRLAQAYHLSGDARYGEGLLRQLDGWLRQCPPLRGPNWTSSLELGIRLINWSLIWQLIGGRDSALFAGAAGAALRRAWLDSIFAHCLYIRRHLSRHSSANNHLVGELAGLYVAARTWPCWPHSAGWRRRAKAELEQQARLQHAADGVNREQAFSYQIFTAEFLLMAGLAGARAGETWSPAYWQTLQRGLHFVAAVRDAGGHMPMVGDADDGTVFRLEPGPVRDRGAMLLALGRAMFEADAPRCAEARWLLGGLAPLAPPLPAASDWQFADGGYLLFGTRFGAADEIKGMVDCGPLGYLGIAAHGHADALALTLSVCGQPCLVDPGTYSYWQAQQWRDYFRGTSAHNTLRVDGLDQSVSGGRFMWTRKARCVVERMPGGPAQFDFVGAHDGYRRLAEPLRHRRSVRFDAATLTLEVDDEAGGRQSHLLEQFWHFAPDLQLSLEGRVLQVRGERFALRAEFSGPALALELVRGQEQPPLGWYSARYEQREPAPTLRVATREAGAVLRARFKIDVLL